MPTSTRVPTSRPYLSVWPILGGFALMAFAFVNVAPNTRPWISRLPPALVANGALAAWAMTIGSVTPGGAAAGLVVGALLWVAAGWQGWVLLGLAFLMTLTSTRLGRRRKVSQGIAEARQGRRAAGNVLANTGLAPLVAFVAACYPDEPQFVVAMAAAMATGASDTVASEVGKALGGRTRLVPSLRIVPPGTTGAMSVAGTCAGTLAAAVFGSTATLVGLTDPTGGLVIAGSAIGAFVAEGMVAQVLEARGVLDNDGVNLVACAIGAALAVGVQS